METAELKAWRNASNAACRQIQSCGSLFSDFLLQGGPDAIKSLQSSVQRLKQELESVKGDKKLEHFRKLQKDLQEADKVHAVLRHYMHHTLAIEDETIDDMLAKKLFPYSTLYGSSREELLRENRILRAQLDSTYVTTRTMRSGAVAAAGLAGSSSKGSTPTKSKVAQAQMMQAPHMETVSALLAACQGLHAAEQAYKLPRTRTIEVQVDDNSKRLMEHMQSQVALLTGQKINLMQRVAELEQTAKLLDNKYEGAMEQVSELRRQKTDLLSHNTNISADLRAHMASEAHRADSAEAAATQALACCAQLEKAAAAAAAGQSAAEVRMAEALATLQEKREQVDVLTGLNLQLAERMEALQGDVQSALQDMAKRVLAGVRHHGDMHQQALQGMSGHVDAARSAAAGSASCTTALAAQQRMLVTHVEGLEAVTLAPLQKQLVATQALLLASETERKRVTKQAVAAAAMARLEVRQADLSTKLLMRDALSEALTTRLAPVLSEVVTRGEEVAAAVEVANEQLTALRLTGGKGSALGPHQIDTYPQGDDQTSKLLADSRLLRAQLHTLSHFEPVYHTFEPQIEALMHAQTEEDARRIRSMQEEMLGQDVDVHGVEYEHARGSGQGQMLTTQPHDPISW